MSKVVHGRVVGACRPCYPGVSSSKLTSNKLHFCLSGQKFVHIYKKQPLLGTARPQVMRFWGPEKKSSNMKPHEVSKIIKSA